MNSAAAFRDAVFRAVLSVALLTSPALAHVTLEAQQALAFSTYKGVFRVPHGCEGAATVRITVNLPEGVTQAQPMPKPGWRLTTQRREGGPQPAGHGTLPEVASVTWDGGPLDSTHYDEFVVRFRTPDRPGELIYIPVTQGCEGGRSTEWTEIPAQGRRPSDYPHIAPALRILPRG
jgi:uncharacterized protein YcnI